MSFENWIGNGVRYAGYGFNYYELGTHELDGHQFPAIAVKGFPFDYVNGAGAALSAGGKTAYGNSVNEGTEELYSYLTERAAKCKDSVFVLGGYSQGAQVVGETYVEKLEGNPALRGRILYNALFGDPKLYLPEGLQEGIIPMDHYTPMCRGEGKSEWRFDVPDCKLDHGSLLGRKPYLPEGFTSSTGLWCNDDDFVCGSTMNPLNNVGHRYDASDMRAASDEIVSRLKKRLPDTAPPADPGPEPSTAPSAPPVGVGTTGLDMVFVIDSTGSMSGDIHEAKETVANMSAWVEKMRGRVALVEYRDAGDEFTARVLSGLQDNTADLNLKLEAMTVDGGGDTPEALLHGMMTALNGLEWRDGATKAAVVLTDATFHAPDRVDGTTLDQVARRALEIDPVNIYPVVDPWNVDAYEELAAATTGQVIVNEGDTSAALEEALSRIETRPVVLLPLMDYYGPVGETFTFDASKSYATGDAVITAYDWDFDGDGVFDASTTTPVQTHTYTAAADEVMQVRVTDSNGQIANMSAFVHVGTETPWTGLPTAPAVTGAATAEDATMATLSWTPNDALAESWAVTVDGIPVGQMEGAARTVTVTDLQRDEPVVLGVAGMAADGSIGDYGTTELPAITAEPTPVPSPTGTATPDPTASPSPDPSPTPSGGPSESATADPTPGQTPTPSQSSTVAPAGKVESPTDSRPGGVLASTGAKVTLALVLGLGFIAVGAAVLAARRRSARQ